MKGFHISFLCLVLLIYCSNVKSDVADGTLLEDGYHYKKANSQSSSYSQSNQENVELEGILNGQNFKGEKRSGFSRNGASQSYSSSYAVSSFNNPMPSSLLTAPVSNPLNSVPLPQLRFENILKPGTANSNVQTSYTSSSGIGTQITGTPGSQISYWWTNDNSPLQPQGGCDSNGCSVRGVFHHTNGGRTVGTAAASAVAAGFNAPVQSTGISYQNNPSLNRRVNFHKTSLPIIENHSKPQGGCDSNGCAISGVFSNTNGGQAIHTAVASATAIGTNTPIQSTEILYPNNPFFNGKVNIQKPSPILGNYNEQPQGGCDSNGCSVSGVFHHNNGGKTVGTASASVASTGSNAPVQSTRISYQNNPFLNGKLNIHKPSPILANNNEQSQGGCNSNGCAISGVFSNTNGGPTIHTATASAAATGSNVPIQSTRLSYENNPLLNENVNIHKPSPILGHYNEQPQGGCDSNGCSVSGVFHHNNGGKTVGTASASIASTGSNAPVQSTRISYQNNLFLNGKLNIHKPSPILANNNEQSQGGCNSNGCAISGVFSNTNGGKAIHTAVASAAVTDSNSPIQSTGIAYQSNPFLNGNMNIHKPSPILGNHNEQAQGGCDSNGCSVSSVFHHNNGGKTVGTASASVASTGSNAPVQPTVILLENTPFPNGKLHMQQVFSTVDQQPQAGCHSNGCSVNGVFSNTNGSQTIGTAVDTEAVSNSSVVVQSTGKLYQNNPFLNGNMDIHKFISSVFSNHGQHASDLNSGSNSGSVSHSSSASSFSVGNNGHFGISSHSALHESINQQLGSNIESSTQSAIAVQTGASTSPSPIEFNGGEITSQGYSSHVSSAPHDDTGNEGTGFEIIHGGNVQGGYIESHSHNGLHGGFSGPVTGQVQSTTSSSSEIGISGAEGVTFGTSNNPISHNEQVQQVTQSGIESDDILSNQGAYIDNSNIPIIFQGHDNEQEIYSSTEANLDSISSVPGFVPQVGHVHNGYGSTLKPNSQIATVIVTESSHTKENNNHDGYSGIQSHGFIQSNTAGYESTTPNINQVDNTFAIHEGFVTKPEVINHSVHVEHGNTFSSESNFKAESEKYGGNIGAGLQSTIPESINQQTGNQVESVTQSILGVQAVTSAFSHVPINGQTVVQGHADSDEHRTQLTTDFDNGTVLINHESRKNVGEHTGDSHQGGLNDDVSVQNGGYVQSNTQSSIHTGIVGINSEENLQEHEVHDNQKGKFNFTSNQNSQNEKQELFEESGYALSRKPDKPFITGYINCHGLGKICAAKHLCIHGYIELIGVTQISEKNQKCDAASEVCCNLKKVQPAKPVSSGTNILNPGAGHVPGGSAHGGLFGAEGESDGDLSAGDNSGSPVEASNGYLPPLGSSSSSNVPAFSQPPKKPQDPNNDLSPSNNNQQQFEIAPIQPQLGCAAALICVEEKFCNMIGSISETPVVLSSEQLLRRVPLVDCRNPDNGIIGKCCRDPNYVDPWPAGNLPANYSGGFDEQGFPKFLNLSKNKPKKPITPNRPFQQPTNNNRQQTTIPTQQPVALPSGNSQFPSLQPQSSFQNTKITPNQFNSFQKPQVPQKPRPFQKLTTEQPPFVPPQQPQFVPPQQPQFVPPQQPLNIPSQQTQNIPSRQPYKIPSQQSPKIPSSQFSQQPQFPGQSQQRPQFQFQKPQEPQPSRQPFQFQKPQEPQPSRQPFQFQQPPTDKPDQFEQSEPSDSEQPEQAVNQPDKLGQSVQPGKTFNFPNVPPALQDIPNQISNQISNLNPFKPQKPVEQPQSSNVISGSADALGITVSTSTQRPGVFPNFPSFPNLPAFPGFGKGHDSSPTNDNPVVIAPHKPGAQCGIINQVRQPGVLSDVDVAFGEIPWQAMILSNSEKKLLCSGVIVAPNLVLTAGNCVYGLNPAEVSIKAGEWKLGYNLKHEEPLPFEIVQVKSIVFHPNYQPDSPSYDTALLFLQNPIKLDLHVDTICLGDAPVPTSQRKCISTGWGKSILHIHAAGALMHKIDVDVLSQEQCSQRLQGAESSIDIDESLVCAKAHKQNNNLCQVDIGGPLACDRGDGNYELVGVYNQDTGCLPTNQVATFALIDTKWVKSVMESPRAPPSQAIFGNKATPIEDQQVPSHVHYHPNQPEVPCDCQQGSLPSGANQYLPPV